VDRESLDRDMLARPSAQAAELAPDRIEFAYRYAEAFYDLEQPDWDAALKAWSALEEKATTPSSARRCACTRRTS
jgi:hypothetical protein